MIQLIGCLVLWTGYLVFSFGVAKFAGNDATFTELAVPGKAKFTGKAAA